MIVAGLYVVLWGKSKELKKMSQLVPEGEQEHTEQVVRVDMPPPPPPLQRSGSSGRKSTAEGEKDANSEILDGLYIYH